MRQRCEMTIYAVEVGELELFLNDFDVFWWKFNFFETISITFGAFLKTWFLEFLITKLEKCRNAKFYKNDSNLIRFASILLWFWFFSYKFWKIIRFSTKSWFLGFRILWSSCQICVTSLMSFSQLNDRHTPSNFTIRNITLFW